MTKVIFLSIAFFLMFSVNAFSQTMDNAELKKMYEEDQSSRMVGNIDWAILSKQDRVRENRVYQLINEGKIITGMDYYHSAMIFQHGGDTLASSMAVKHMRKAIELDTTINKWLLAAAIDRDLMYRKMPQIYGTQYVKKSGDTKWSRYKIDSTQITDEERKYYHVETLAEQRIKEHNMNLRSLSEYYSTSKSIDKTLKFIKSEIKNAEQSEYNVTQDAINTFGYELMHTNKNEDALKLFKLNTKLFPNGYNTFDSYGECLLKLNRKEEGLKAYKKSLELNAKNENARRILEENQ